MAPKRVSGRVVKTGKSIPSSSQREGDLGPLGAADPVALHRDHVLGPGLEQVEVGEQAVGVLGDLEEPLFEVARLDQAAAALAAPVDHLLVGEHRLVDRAPLDRRLGPVGEPALVEAQEQPLGPAVVRRPVAGDLARPVDRDAPGAELLAVGLDRGLGRLARVDACLDRVVLRREAEGVVAHRVDHVVAVAAAEVGERVADRVVLQVADVRLAGRVREHLEHVGLRLRVVETGLAGVRDLPGALALPDLLPATFDRVRVVDALSVAGVHRPDITSARRCGIPRRRERRLGRPRRGGCEWDA